MGKLRRDSIRDVSRVCNRGPEQIIRFHRPGAFFAERIGAGYIYMVPRPMFNKIHGPLRCANQDFRAFSLS
jgi:hypothetical protein